jgi:hypothetical protein
MGPTRLLPLRRLSRLPAVRVPVARAPCGEIAPCFRHQQQQRPVGVARGEPCQADAEQPVEASRLKQVPTTCAHFIGWAKARLRAVPTRSERAAWPDCVGTLRFAHPCMGHFLSSTFFDVVLLLSYFLPIFFSFFVRLESRFFVPTCRARVTPRAAAVKDGRRRAGGTNSVVGRPRLDGVEHGVTLHLVGTRDD